MNRKRILASAVFCLAAAAFSQDKPTAAQTAEFIRANYPQGFEYVASLSLSEGEKFLCGGEISDLTLEFTGSKVTVSWLDVLKTAHLRNSGIERHEDRVEHVVSFDLKDMEAIEGVTPDMMAECSYGDAESGAFPAYLSFKAANGKAAVTASANGQTSRVAAARIPYGLDGREANHQILRDLKNTQVFKAFEHLRRLSGAPDPIRF